MEGIFYCYEGNLNSLLHRYTPVSEALSEEQIAPSLNESVRMFLMPLLGTTVLEQLEGIAEKRNPSTAEAMVLDEARRAAVHLALFLNFDELNTHFTDQGWKREEGDTYKSLYHYQEISLRNGFKNKGYNSIDRLLELLQAAIATFPNYTNSPAYIDKKTSLVKGASEIQELVNINSSPLVFLAAKPNLLIVQQNELQNVVGSACYDILINYLNDGTLPSGATETTMETLRKYAAKYVICLAMARQMVTEGTLTDRGLYYESQMNSDRSVLKIQPVDSDVKDRTANMLLKDARMFQGRLLSYIERNFASVYCGRPADAFRRDNDLKRTFWT